VAQWRDDRGGGGRPAPDYYTVTYLPGAQGTFAEQTTSGLILGVATPAFAGATTGNAGWTFAGWSPVVSPTLTGDAPSTAQWRDDRGGRPDEPQREVIIATIPNIITEQIDFEDFEDELIPLTDGYTAIDLGNDVYEIFDDEGTPVGVVIVPEGETLEEWFDIEEIIPLAEFIQIIDEEPIFETVAEVIIIDEVEMEDIRIDDIPTAPTTGDTAPRTGNPLVFSIILAVLAGTAALLFKKRRII